jgi:hypothetical protein
MARQAEPALGACLAVKLQGASMSLILPGNIPVAAESLESLTKFGSPWILRARSEALVLVTNDKTDPCIVWASPKLKSYRAVWDAASAAGFVEPAGEWGDNVDIDHVFPKSWANLPGSNLKYVRLFPVWGEVNRSAGAGREKGGLKTGVNPIRQHGIVYAGELQVLKILGHPVGTAADPVSIFGVKRRR